METLLIPDYPSSVGGSTAATRRAERKAQDDLRRLEQAKEALGIAHRGGDEGPAYKQALRTAVKASQQVYRNQLEPLIAAAAEYVTALDQTLAQMPDDSPRAQRDEDRAHAAIAAQQQRNLTAEQFSVWEKAHEEARRAEKAHRNALREARDAAADYHEAATYSRKHPKDLEAKKRADEAYARWRDASEQVEPTAQAALAAAYNDALAASGDGTVPCTAEMAKACIEKLAGQDCGGECAESKCTCTMFDAYGNEMDREILDPIKIQAERGQAAQAAAEEKAEQFFAAVGRGGEAVVEKIVEGVGEIAGSVASGVSKLLSWLEPPGRGEGAKTPEYSAATSKPPPKAPQAAKGSDGAVSTRGTFSRLDFMPEGAAPGSGAATGGTSSCQTCAEALATIAAQGEANDSATIKQQRDCLWTAAYSTVTAAGRLTDGLDKGSSDLEQLVELVTRCSRHVSQQRSSATPADGEAPMPTAGKPKAPEDRGIPLKPGDTSPPDPEEPKAPEAQRPSHQEERERGRSTETEGRAPGIELPPWLEHAMKSKPLPRYAVDCARLLRTALQIAWGEGDHFEKHKRIVQLLFPVAKAAGLVGENDFVHQNINRAVKDSKPDRLGWVHAATELFYILAPWCYRGYYDESTFPLANTIVPRPPPTTKRPQVPPTWADCKAVLALTDPRWGSHEDHGKLLDYATKHGIGTKEMREAAGTGYIWVGARFPWTPSWGCSPVGDGVHGKTIEEEGARHGARA